MTKEDRDYAINHAIGSILLKMEDLVSLAEWLEEAHCKSEGEKIRKIASQLESVGVDLYNKLKKGVPR